MVDEQRPSSPSDPRDLAAEIRLREVGEPEGARFSAALLRHWPEYVEARFSPLAEIDPVLAARLTERIVDRILRGAGLSAVHRSDAIAQTLIEVGVMPDGRRCVFQVRLPLGSGNPAYSWDGSINQAEEFADSAADRGVEDVVWDQANVGPTGWEPEFEEG